jgi:glyoxalase family protein
MASSAGIHHVTAICSEPQRNVAFYTGGLGLRLVKRTVNFDDPRAWHLYYGDETGSPGTALTFFAWRQFEPARKGVGLASATAFIIPERSLAYWTERLGQRGIPYDPPEQRLGQTVVAFRDPDGMSLELVATIGARALPAWSGGDVPSEHAIRGFAGVTLAVAEAGPTARVLTEVFGWREDGREHDRHRFRCADGLLGAAVDLLVRADDLARVGVGSVHHVAFRAADDAAEIAMATRARAQGLRPTDPIDRLYFRSVYFREPGGVLFEIATDGPGFTADEPKESLGTSLRLPPWLEARRAEIAAALPPLNEGLGISR